MAWQGTQGYNCAALTPHEAKMSKVISGLRGTMITLGLTLIPLAAITYLNHPEFTSQAAAVNQELSSLYPDDATLQTQMRVPLVLSHILPVGLIGAFTAAMIGFAISTHNTYLHSWGSILIQDVICPLRKNPLSQKRHMFYLRTSIIAVAVFAFIFGLIFPLQEYIYMFFQITGAIYLGGAGSAIIGGLYWKRGTATAAWVSMIAGSVVAASTIVLRIVWADIPFLVERWGPVFPMNSQVMSFFAALIGIGCYVTISLLSKDPNVNMDRLLHRGQYALKEEEDEIKARVKKEEKVGRFWRFIGVNSHEFTKVDKGLFLYTFCMSMYGILGFAATLILGLIGWMTDQRWLTWWLISLGVWLAIGTVGVVWVGIGGLVDLKKMYHRLATIKRNVLDDGRVQGDHLLADEIEGKAENQDI
jgi:SSS family solute:Na+ symporter